MISPSFAAQLLEDAEERDKKNYPAQIALLKESFDFFNKAGLPEAEIRQVMALTAEQVRRMRRRKRRG